MAARRRWCASSSPKRIQRSVVCVWIIRFILIILLGWFVVTRLAPAVISPRLSFPSIRGVKQPVGIDSMLRRETSKSIESSALLSRNPEVKVTTDVRGNLGPPSVMIQETPGTDWLKDRWQAASDMHGTAIPGVHWVMLEFPSPVNGYIKGCFGLGGSLRSRLSESRYPSTNNSGRSCSTLIMTLTDERRKSQVRVQALSRRRHSI
jgi:hypothetical protein